MNCNPTRPPLVDLFSSTLHLERFDSSDDEKGCFFSLIALNSVPQRKASAVVSCAFKETVPMFKSLENILVDRFASRLAGDVCCISFRRNLLRNWYLLSFPAVIRSTAIASRDYHFAGLGPLTSEIQSLPLLPIACPAKRRCRVS